jgi:hypothetical protein
MPSRRILPPQQRVTVRARPRCVATPIISLIRLSGTLRSTEPSAGRSSAIPVAGTECRCRRVEYCRPAACNGESATQAGRDCRSFRSFCLARTLRSTEPSAGRSSAIPVAGTERRCRRAECCRPPACNGESATQGGSRLPIISLILPGAHALIDRAPAAPAQSASLGPSADAVAPNIAAHQRVTVRAQPQGGSRLPIISLILPGGHAPIDRTRRIPA